MKIKWLKPFLSSLVIFPLSQIACSNKDIKNDLSNLEWNLELILNNRGINKSIELRKDLINAMEKINKFFRADENNIYNFCEYYHEQLNLKNQIDDYLSLELISNFNSKRYSEFQLLNKELDFKADEIYEIFRSKLYMFKSEITTFINSKKLEKYKIWILKSWAKSSGDLLNKNFWIEPFLINDQFAKVVNILIKNIEKDVLLEDNFYRIKEFGQTFWEIYKNQWISNNMFAKLKGYDNYADFAFKKIKTQKNPIFEYFNELNKYQALFKKFKNQKHSNLLVNEYSVEEAKLMILNALKPLGKEYIGKVQNLFEMNFVSWFPNFNKSKRVFSKTVNNGKWSYISINFDNSIGSIFELIHEIGHAIESSLAIPGKNKEVTFDNEISSIVNEMLLFFNLLEHKMSGIYQLLIDKFFDYVLVKNTNYKFESNIIFELSQNRDVTYKEGERIYEYMWKTYGLSNEQLPNLPSYLYNFISFISSPTTYSNLFISYHYPISAIFALIIAKKIIDNDKSTITNYLQFLQNKYNKETRNKILLSLVGDWKNIKVRDNIYGDIELILSNL